MMLSIELRVDVGGSDYIPHSFIVVTGPDGNERGYGLAPAEHGTLVGDGKIYDDTLHEYSKTTGKLPLSETQYKNLMSFINDSEKNPPPYYLPFGSQCANWAVKALVEAGIPAVTSPNLLPDNFLRDIFETIVWNPYSQWLNISVNDLFDAARGQVIIQRRDPVVLDLDGDGIETVGTSVGVMFDHDGDGVKNASGWVKGDDAFVVLDRNDNGRIDNGGELFGDHTVLASGKKAANGFEALAELDENKDGVFNATDARFAEVKLWRDLNQNGVSDAGELKSFAESGVLSIDLKGVTKDGQTLAGGNILAQRTTYTRSNGTTGLTGTVDDAATNADAEITEGSSGALDLTSDPFYREFTDPVAVTESGLGYGYLFKFKPIETAIAIT